MTLANMINWLEGYGFEVSKRLIENCTYVFTIIRGDVTRTYDFEWPKTDNIQLKDQIQRNFLYMALKDFETYEKEHFIQQAKEDKKFVDYTRRDTIVTANLYLIRAMTIERVIHNDPATIVFWADGTKTVVKCQPGDIYDPEKGLAMAISKKALGNCGNYCNVFKKWVPEEKKTEPVIATDVEEPWRIWFRLYDINGGYRGSGVYHKEYASKSSATRAAKRMYDDSEHWHYEWIVSRTNPWGVREG